VTNLRTLDANAARLLSAQFRLGLETPAFDDYEKDIDYERDVDLAAVRTFLDETMRRHSPHQVTDADVWLAPRLHYALRLTRREAANRAVWRWLGVVFAPDYVRWRWGPADESQHEPDAAAKAERFDGPDYKHALARLWWMAELFRDGPDYAPVVLALRNPDIQNNLFRMDIAHHRPTVQAAVRVLADRTGREANALAKAANSAASTLVIDTIAPDSLLDPEACRTWLLGDDIDPVRYLDELPPGPADPRVDPGAVATMVDLLETLLGEAPVRGRESEAISTAH
jgi:hypothetical protein